MVLIEDTLLKKHVLCNINNVENPLPEVPEKIFVVPKKKLLEFSFDPVDGRFFVKARKLKSKDLENMWEPTKNGQSFVTRLCKRYQDDSNTRLVFS